MAAKISSVVFWTVLVGCIIPAAVDGAVGRSVAITVPERGGAGRTGQYASFGVPIPRAWKLTPWTTKGVWSFSNPIRSTSCSRP